MISPSDIIGPWKNSPDLTEERIENISDLVPPVNALLAKAKAAGISLPINPKTGTQVSGEQYGGFRPQTCPIGAPLSAHKQGMAVDIYDPDNKLDEWITDDVLRTVGLYREGGHWTPGWTHLTTRRPGSGNRTFIP